MIFSVLDLPVLRAAPKGADMSQDESRGAFGESSEVSRYVSPFVDRCMSRGSSQPQIFVVLEV